MQPSRLSPSSPTTAGSTISATYGTRHYLGEVATHFVSRIRMPGGLPETPKVPVAPPGPAQESVAAGEHQAEVFASADAAHFWGAERSVTLITPFSDQLMQATAQPQLRAQRIFAQPLSIMGGEGGKVGRSRRSFTEAEGLVNLAAFLDAAEEVAAGDQTEEGHMMHDMVVQFRTTLAFLGANEYHAACHGIAEMWAAYVGQGPEHIINVFAHERKGIERKSHQVVFDDIRHEFRQLTAGSELTVRLRVTPERWQDTPAAKLVVTEDWINSGLTVQLLVEEAAAEAKAAGKPALAARLEAHVLVARAVDIHGDWTNGRDNSMHEVRFGLRTYYRSGSDQLESPLSGAHASAEGGFEVPLKKMHDYLARRDIDLELPWLTHIQRVYEGGPLLSNGRANAMLEEQAVLNGVMRDCDRELKVLRKRAADMIVDNPQDDTYERIEELEEQRLRAERDGYGLANAYEALVTSAAQSDIDNN